MESIASDQSYDWEGKDRPVSVADVDRSRPRLWNSTDFTNNNTVLLGLKYSRSSAYDGRPLTRHHIRNTPYVAFVRSALCDWLDRHAARDSPSMFLVWSGRMTPSSHSLALA